MSVHCEKCGQAKWLAGAFNELRLGYDAAQARIQELESIKTPGRVEHLLKEKDSRIAELEKALGFYADKKNWEKWDGRVAIVDEDTELSDYVHQLGAEEYGGKLARSVLKGEKK